MVTRIDNFPKPCHRWPTMSLRALLAVVTLCAIYFAFMGDLLSSMLANWQWERFGKGFYGGFWWAGLFDADWRWARSGKTGDAVTGTLVGGVAAMGIIVVAVVVPAFAVVGRIISRRTLAGDEHGEKHGDERHCNEAGDR